MSLLQGFSQRGDPWGVSDNPHTQPRSSPFRGVATEKGPAEGQSWGGGAGPSGWGRAGAWAGGTWAPVWGMGGTEGAIGQAGGGVAVGKPRNVAKVGPKTASPTCVRLVKFWGFMYAAGWREPRCFGGALTGEHPTPSF